MTDYDIHRPSFDGTTRNDWEFPVEVDFDTDDRSVVAEHFLLSSSGFDDPEGFDDLELPVVNTRGYLSLNGLWAARRGPYSVERVEGLDDDTAVAVRELIDDLGEEHFEDFADVTVSESEWAEATAGGPANPLDGIAGRVVGSAQPSYTPLGSVVGLVFLAGAAVVVDRLDDERP